MENMEIDIWNQFIEQEETDQLDQKNFIINSSEKNNSDFLMPDRVEIAKGELKDSLRQSNFNIQKQTLTKNCILETIVSLDQKLEDHSIDLSYQIKNPCKKYSFALDDFQKAAVISIERNTSVLVAAHTSAGKTAVAEYVIAKCLQNDQRVIYTSPIKALSNQKYRDLKQEFGKVGLITGDINIDENQSCLVMTTEILRNMLFKSNEIAKETAWIIFDEAHYLKDKERGVIWEETIILAPKNVWYCLLSATAPNASELAQWIAKVKGLDCINVIYTDYRPTPLQYLAYMSGSKKMLLVKDAQGSLHNENFQQLHSLTTEEKQKSWDSAFQADLLNIAKTIFKKKFFPAIFFAFSKKKVELIAKNLAKNLNMLSSEQKSQIVSLYNTMISSLSEEDQQLPQVKELLSILQSGIGLHHGGMLPILKEIVEILFQSGLIQILISTETFSMGVNMPAKCVVFTSIQKWDGEQFRMLEGSEYVQMSGWAGRRGKDSFGIVITMLEPQSDVGKYQRLLQSQSKNDPLISQFKISYNMLINTLVMEGLQPEEIVLKSFKQFQYDNSIYKNSSFLSCWKIILEQFHQQYFQDFNRFQVLEKICQAKDRQKENNTGMHAFLTSKDVLVKYITIGRLFFIEGLGWCPLVNFQLQGDKTFLHVFSTLALSKVDYLRKRVECNCQECVSHHQLEELIEPEIIQVSSDYIWMISTIVLKMPQNMIEKKQLFILKETINTIINEQQHKIPLVNLSQNVKFQNQQQQQELVRLEEEQKNIEKELQEQILKLKEIENNQQPFILLNQDKIEEVQYHSLINTEYYYNHEILIKLFETDPLKIENQNLRIHKEISSFQLLYQFSNDIRKMISSNQQKPESYFSKQILQMKNILRRLGMLNDQDIPNQKGKVASLMQGCDELLLTEIIFQGTLRNLDARQIVVILSMFINEEQMNGDKKKVQVTDKEIIDIYYQIDNIHKNFQKIYQEEYQEDYEKCVQNINQLNPSMFKEIQMWYEGKSFLQITKGTQLFEGTIIRNIKRLFELLRQIQEALLLIGNKDLLEKVESGSQKLYRGIAFSNSLYI